MLQKRRVFDLTNTIMNYVFMVFLLFAGIYLASFWFELKSDFISSIVVCANVVAWTVTALSVMLVLIALFIAVADYEFKWGTIIWSICRMVVCIIVSIIIDVSSILVSEGVTVSL